MGQDGLLHIGSNDYVSVSRILVITNLKRDGLGEQIEEARQEGRLLDLTGRKTTRSALFLDTDHLVLTPVRAETLVSRVQRQLVLREAARGLYGTARS